jgi:hypothetical protein
MVKVKPCLRESHRYLCSLQLFLGCISPRLWGLVEQNFKIDMDLSGIKVDNRHRLVFTPILFILKHEGGLHGWRTPLSAVHLASRDLPVLRGVCDEVSNHEISCNILSRNHVRERPWLLFTLLILHKPWCGFVILQAYGTPTAVNKLLARMLMNYVGITLRGPILTLLPHQSGIQVPSEPL